MSGTDYRKKLLADGPVIILVNPQLGENIGTAIRAMTNFGLTELRLVNPRDGWPSEPARAAAAGADHVVDGAKVFETLEKALHDLSFVYATSARNRDMLKPVKGPGEAVAALRARHHRGEKPAYCLAVSGQGFLMKKLRWLTRSSHFRSILPLPHSTLRRRCC